MEDLGEFQVMNQIGVGSFGEIYTVRSSIDGKIYAAKVEPRTKKHKTLKFESKILRLIQSSNYAPKLISFGKAHRYFYYVMNLLGPSLSSVLHKLNRIRLSFSSGIRVAYHLLKAIQDIHKLGIIHRDIKPANILTTGKNEYPIVLIDYGLAKLYLDQNGKHLPPRKYPGFRGTAMFASPNAHLNKDLSRRDDLVSWYYVVFDLLTGGLPWRGLNNRKEIYRAKKKFTGYHIFNNRVPELVDIWFEILSLKYSEKPKYNYFYKSLNKIMKRNKINLNDPYDWNDIPFETDIEGNPNDANQNAYGALSSKSSSTKRKHKILLDRVPLSAKYNNHGLNERPLITQTENDDDDDDSDTLYCCCSVA